MDLLVAEREEVAAACRRLSADGLVRGTSGNVSVRAGDLVAVTPTGAALAELTAEDVAVVNRDGVQQDGALAPTSELGLHLSVYARFDSGAVVHTHAPTATALACVLTELPVVHYEMLALGGAVRVAPYATFGTPELAELAAEALEGRAAALLANHGTVSHGPTLAAAIDATDLLEWAARAYATAAAVGEPRILDDDEQRQVVEVAVARRYGETKAL